MRMRDGDFARPRCDALRQIGQRHRLQCAIEVNGETEIAEHLYRVNPGLECAVFVAQQRGAPSGSLGKMRRLHGLEAVNAGRTTAASIRTESVRTPRLYHAKHALTRGSIPSGFLEILISSRLIF